MLSIKKSQLGNMAFWLAFSQAYFLYADVVFLKVINYVLLFLVLFYGCFLIKIRKIELVLLSIFLYLSVVSYFINIPFDLHGHANNFRIVFIGLISFVFFRHYRVNIKYIKLLFYISLFHILLEIFFGLRIQIFEPQNEYWVESGRILGLFNNYHLSAFLIALMALILFGRNSILRWAFLVILIQVKVLTITTAYLLAIIYQSLSKNLRYFAWLGAVSTIIALPVLIDLLVNFSKSIDFYKTGGMIYYQSMIKDYEMLDSVYSYILPMNLNDRIEAQMLNGGSEAILLADIGFYSYLSQLGIICGLIFAVYIFRCVKWTLVFICISLLHNAYVLLPLGVALILESERINRKE